MHGFNDKEYLELLQQLTELQYNEPILDPNEEQIEWIPADPPAKSKLPKLNSGTMDLTDTISTQIKDYLFNHSHFKIGKFKMRINRTFEVPSQTGLQPTMSIEIWEERSKTPNGMPCRIDFPLNLDKDTRFLSCQWRKYFHGNSAHNVPVDQIIEIIRWLQVSIKLSSFF